MDVGILMVVKLGGSPRFIVSTPPAPEDVRHVDLQKREWGFGDVLLGHWALVTWCATVLREDLTEGALVGEL